MLGACPHIDWSKSQSNLNSERIEEEEKRVISSCMGRLRDIFEQCSVTCLARIVVCEVFSFFDDFNCFSIVLQRRVRSKKGSISFLIRIKHIGISLISHQKDFIKTKREKSLRNNRIKDLNIMQPHTQTKSMDNQKKIIYYLKKDIKM